MKPKIGTTLFALVLVASALTACTTNRESIDNEPIVEIQTSMEQKSTADTTDVASRGTEAEPIAAELVLELAFSRSGTSASNQYAVWIENANGELVTTLYVSNFTARGGYATREDSLSTWVSKALPQQMDAYEIDALAGATPQSGVYQYIWDGTDNTGAMVPAGEYHIYVEGTLYWSSSVVYSGTVRWGGESQSIDMLAFYTEEDEETNKEMLTLISAEYVLDE